MSKKPVLPMLFVLAAVFACVKGNSCSVGSTTNCPRRANNVYTGLVPAQYLSIVNDLEASLTEEEPFSLLQTQEVLGVSLLLYCIEHVSKKVPKQERPPKFRHNSPKYLQNVPKTSPKFPRSYKKNSAKSQNKTFFPRQYCKCVHSFSFCSFQQLALQILSSW